MCEYCNETLLNINHIRPTDSFIESARQRGWLWNKKAIIEDGYMLCHKNYDLIITKEYFYVLKNQEVLDMYENSEKLFAETFRMINHRAKIHYFESFKSKLQKKLSEATKIMKTWVVSNPDTACQYCKALDGKTIPEKHPFFITVNGVVYAKQRPPLHYAMTKDGRRVRNCHCFIKTSEQKV